MTTIDAADISDFLDTHEVIEPVTIARHGQPLAMIIPYDLYQEWRRHNPRALRAEELSNEDMAAIQNSPVPEEHGEYNDELDK
ncbi:MAG TPA: hypothetical protein ENJ80_02720 [Gammaproteobacteria bacterium]|nr:hypothetical protein [Gammaproteobacteria bacterium]